MAAWGRIGRSVRRALTGGPGGGTPPPAPVRLGPGVWKQRRDQSIAELLRDAGLVERPAATPRRLVHIINPFAAPEGSEWQAIQQAALNSIARARATAAPGTRIDIVAVAFEGETIPTLPGTLEAPRLTRGAADIGTFGRPRPLPLLFDILAAGATHAAPSDHVVFTNMDINLVPHFYDTVGALLAAGADAMTINRWDIDKAYLDRAEAVWPLAAAEHAPVHHRGYDCFVYRADRFASFRRTDAVVGMGAVMRSLLYNMVAFSDAMLMLTNVSLTYHFGNDVAWRDATFDDYDAHNRVQALAAVRALMADPGAWERLRPFLAAHERHVLRGAPPDVQRAVMET